MILCFELSIPGRNSWNGRWSGEGRLYALIINLGDTKKACEKGKTIIQEGPYSYSWPDGWRASISVKQVDSKEANQIRKHSSGFCGYDWMVDSIIYYGEIKSGRTV